MSVLYEPLPTAELVAATEAHLAPEAVLGILLQVCAAADGLDASHAVAERAAVLEGRQLLMAAKEAKSPGASSEFMLQLLGALSGGGGEAAESAELKVVAGVLRKGEEGARATLEFLMWGPWSPEEGPWGPLGLESGEDGHDAAAHLERWLHLERATVLNSMLGRWEVGVPEFRN